MARRLRRRYAAERRFRRLGAAAVALSAAFLAFLLITMLAQGLRGFTETRVTLPVDLGAAQLPIEPARLKGRGADLALAGSGLEDAVDIAATMAFGPDGTDLLSPGAWIVVRDAVKADPALLRRTTRFSLPIASRYDVAAKGNGTSDAEAVVARLKAKGVLSTGWDLGFLRDADATDPTGVGIWGAAKGSLLTMLVTLVLAFPIGVLAALYLEEYAPKNRWTDMIEVSINNLAAVPSIIFGLLGLAVFLGSFGLPRSAPLVGGLTLALMTMPVIVIAARNAIKAVPPSIRDAALAIGASAAGAARHPDRHDHRHGPRAG
jgi:phosphate transport system permease protein